MKDKIVYEGRFIRTIEREFVTQKGNKQIWEMLERKSNSDIVAVLPVTSKEELIFIKIYRVAMAGYVFECCAGLIDEGEEPIEAAKRELLEETGYTASQFLFLAKGPFDTGIAKDQIHLFLAQDAVYHKAPTPEETEDIEVFCLPLQEVEDFLLAPTQTVPVDLKLFSGLNFLKNRYSFRRVNKP